MFFTILLLSVFCLTPSTLCHAETCYENSATGYRVEIEDDADLLSSSEETELLQTMQKITTYGNAAFKSISTNTYSTTKAFASDYYQDIFGETSGILFLIDMDERVIWIHCNGAIYDVITRDYANTITDNVYRYASAKNYFPCVDKAFTQALSLLAGEKIAQPMKHISNALLAMLVALFINFGFVCYFSHIKKPVKEEVLGKLNKNSIPYNPHKEQNIFSKDFDI